MKTLDFDELKKGCPWHFSGASDYRRHHCTAQRKECHPLNCAVFYFVVYLNRPIFVIGEDEDE